MNSSQFAPRDNYERNFNMVKHFCGKSLILGLLVLLFIYIGSSIYVLFSSNGQLEIALLNIGFSKLNIQIEAGSYSSAFSLITILAAGFFTFCLILIYTRSKNESPESSPQSGLYTLYLVTIGELVLLGFSFFIILISTFVIIIAKTESLNYIPNFLNMSADELSSNKLSIVMIMVLLNIIILFSMWAVQSQADFLKSIKSSLTDSVPKNKGAHTYGIFCLIIGIVLLSSAAVTTFLYYCYKEAFNGMGIKISDVYVFISLSLAYVKGLIPLLIGIIAFSYSNIVDETNTMGTLYTDYGTIGEAVDPNFQRSSTQGSSNKFIR